MRPLFKSSLKRRYLREVSHHLQVGLNHPEAGRLTESDLNHLPELIKEYLRKCGVVGHQKVRNFKVELAGQLRKKSDSVWMPFHSEQYNFMATTARLFYMNAVMKHLPVSGYHYFRNGVAYMDIRLLSLLRVQYAAGDQMNRAETVTFLNDMCCFAPATLIDARITWTQVNDTCVKATFTNKDIVISAQLHFNERNELINFISDDRFALSDDGSFKQLRWSTPFGQYEDRFGYHLPRHAETVYEYEDGSFTYGIFEVINITYNNA